MPVLAAADVSATVMHLIAMEMHVAPGALGA